MNQYFSKFGEIIKERKTASRIHFILQDLLDLRRVTHSNTHTHTNCACMHSNTHMHAQAWSRAGVRAAQGSWLSPSPQNLWVPRREKQGPKTIDQIHKDVELEEHREQMKVQQAILSKSSGGDRMGGRGQEEEEEGEGEEEEEVEGYVW